MRASFFMQQAIQPSPPYPTCLSFLTPPSFGHLPYMANATQRRRVNTNPSYSLTVKFIPMNFLLNRERGSTQFCYCCWCCTFTLAVLRNATGHGRERLRCISAFAPASIYVRFLRNITSHHGKRRGLRCRFEYSFYLYSRIQERI